MGVPTKTRTPGADGSGTEFESIAHVHTPARERAGLRFERHRRAPHDRRNSARHEGHRAQHDTVAVAERDVDREAHSERVHIATRSQHHDTVDSVATEQTARPASGAGGLLGCGQHLTVTNEPHRGRRYPEPPRDPALGCGPGTLLG